MKEETLNQFAAGLCSEDLQNLKLRHKELLDTIDSLRGLDIGKYVELPQIIVVGDQSSGKSSVLEAISRVSFPSKGTLCTRFATELVLREADDTSMEVTIQAHESASKDTKKKLSKFSRTQKELLDLSKIVTEATEYMGIDGVKTSFSKNILRIKVSGPDIPQLTLVDLPGFYYAGGEKQPAEHRATVTELAEEYMKRESSIILAVVSAKNDPALQRVLDEAKRFDPRGQRTIGIVTKPDQLERGALENAFLRMLQNKKESENHLKHGWHVLRNRSEDEPQDVSSRDANEAELFNTEPWTKISSKNKGISTLRGKLSNILLFHIANKLPKVIDRIEQLVEDRRTSLRQLGDPRTETRHYMRHLESVASHFTNLAEQAVSGERRDEVFFGELTPETALDVEERGRNLRARVRKLNSGFITMMQICGPKRKIEWRDPHDQEPWSRSASADEEFEYFFGLYGAEMPVSVSQDELEQQVHRWAIATRGIELPGFYSDKLALSLFEDQAKPWKQLAMRHIELVMESAEALAAEIIQYVIGEDDEFREKVMTVFINPFFKDRKAALAEKLVELLPQHHKSGYPFALEDTFKTRVLTRTQTRTRREIDDLRNGGVEMPKHVYKALQIPEFAQDSLNAHRGTTRDWGMSHILECMVEQYGMTLETFMTNVIILGIENQLMAPFPEIFTTSKIMQLSDQQLEKLAGESEDVKEAREELKIDLERLEAGAELCRQWKHKSKALVPGLKELTKPATFVRKIGGVEAGIKIESIGDEEL